MEPIREAWVFVDMPAESEPVLAGRLVLEGGSGKFVYGKKYLSRPDAFALDPLNLPLLPTTQEILGNDGVPAVLLDAGPDNWGKRLMMAVHTRHPHNKLEELLATKGTGVGAIRVSLSRSHPKQEPDYPSVDSLMELNKNIQSLLKEGKVPQELLRQLEPGSSMGGARPKSVVKDEDGSLFIAKFTRPDDLFDQSKAEQMCFLMMKDCGINTAESQLIEVAGRSVLLVKRFDVGDLGRRHFISAHALMYKPRVRESDLDRAFSYPALSDCLMMLGGGSSAQAELFRRLVFNVLMCNTDDHLRNHGLLKNIENNEYQLSPAYDVVPQPGSTSLQAISIGSGGRYRSVENCLGAAKYFSLSDAEARSVVDQTFEVVQQWQIYAGKVGLSEADQNVLQGAIMAAPSTLDFDSLSEQLDQIGTSPAKGQGPKI